jgi:hypothetical protein
MALEQRLKTTVSCNVLIVINTDPTVPGTVWWRLWPAS